MKILWFILLAVSVNLPAGEVQITTSPESGQLTWKVEDHGLSLELIQLFPDNIRATYMARGLPDEIIEGVASYCVFGTIAKNTSDNQVSYRVADWRAETSAGNALALKTKTQWVSEWHKLGVPFSYSILPDDQTFEIGDWSQGFTTVKLPRGSQFDLVYSWTTGDEKHSRKIEGIRCASE